MDHVRANIEDCTAATSIAKQLGCSDSNNVPIVAVENSIDCIQEKFNVIVDVACCCGYHIFVLFAYTIVPIPTNKMTTRATDKECDIHRYVRRRQWDHIIGDTTSHTEVSKDTKSKHPFLGALRVVSAITMGTVTCLWYWV